MQDKEDFYWEAVIEIQELIQSKKEGISSLKQKSEAFINSTKNNLSKEQLNKLFQIQARLIKREQRKF